MTFQSSFSCLILLLSSAPLVPFQLRSFCHWSSMSSRCFVHDFFSVLHYVWKYVPNLWYGEQIDTISTMWGSPNNISLAAYLSSIGCQDLDPLPLFILGLLTQQPQAQRSNHFCFMLISNSWSTLLFPFTRVGPPENWWSHAGRMFIVMDPLYSNGRYMIIIIVLKYRDQGHVLSCTVLSSALITLNPNPDLILTIVQL